MHNTLLFNLILKKQIPTYLFTSLILSLRKQFLSQFNFDITMKLECK